MQDKIGFSFILTNYNAERYIGEAIKSVFNQDYDGPMELIVVDDCSTDDSCDVITETIQLFSHDFDVRFVKTSKNGGTAKAFDTGMAMAKYDWLVMLDGDDIQLPDRSAYTAELIRKYPDVLMITMAARKIGADGEEWGVNHPVFSGPLSEHPDELYLDTSLQRFKNCLIESDEKNKIIYFQGVINRKLYELWGGLSVAEMCSVHFYQDLSWGMRAALSGPILASSRAVTLYRFHGANQHALTSTSADSSSDVVMATELLREKIWPGLNRTYGSVVQSVQRAIDDSSHSDLNVAQLMLVLKQWKRLRQAYFMLDAWWSLNWWTRLYRVFKYGLFVRGVHLRMALIRLLPKWLFCHLKGKHN